jgi:hypothetical protein
MCFGRFVVVSIAIALANPAFADRVRYGGTKDLTAHSASLTVRHRHDWSRLPEQLTFSAGMPFGVEPSVSSLEFRTGTGNSVTRISSPPITFLFVTSDSRYVIGLSQIKAGNDVQLVVFDRNARLLLKRHIAVDVYGFSPETYQVLRTKHSQAFAELDRYSRFVQMPYGWRQDGVVYLDIWVATTEPGWSRLFKDLYPAMRRSPYSGNFGESVSNFVYWYDTDDPAPKIIEKAGQPERITLRDPKGVEMSIPFRSLPLPDTASASASR